MKIAGFINATRDAKQFVRVNFAINVLCTADVVRENRRQHAISTLMEIEYKISVKIKKVLNRAKEKR